MKIKLIALLSAALFSVHTWAMAPAPTNSTNSTNSTNITLCDVIDLMDCK